MVWFKEKLSLIESMSSPEKGWLLKYPGRPLIIKRMKSLRYPSSPAWQSIQAWPKEAGSAGVVGLQKKTDTRVLGQTSAAWWTAAGWSIEADTVSCPDGKWAEKGAASLPASRSAVQSGGAAWSAEVGQEAVGLMTGPTLPRRHICPGRH